MIHSVLPSFSRLNISDPADPELGLNAEAQGIVHDLPEHHLDGPEDRPSDTKLRDEDELKRICEPLVDIESFSLRAGWGKDFQEKRRSCGFGSPMSTLSPLGSGESLQALYSSKAIP